MTMFDRRRATGSLGPRFSRRQGTIAALLILAAALALAPHGVTDAARHAWLRLLQPAQTLAQSAIDATTGFARDWQSAAASREELALAQARAKEWREESERLKRALLFSETSSAAANQPIDSGAVELPPLESSDLVIAHVLGRTAQSALGGQPILGAGSAARLKSGAHVLQSGDSNVDSAGDSKVATIDAGRDAHLETDRLAIVGRAVWGKLASVGPMTSIVRRATDPGYRDLIEIVRVEHGRPVVSSRGVLVGSGASQCRIEMVDATAAVSVGDEVYTAADNDADVRLYYGKISRAELAAGQSHWRLWLQPALADRAPQKVAVLRIGLNPERVVAAQAASADGERR